jgi:hypothetical protein
MRVERTSVLAAESLAVLVILAGLSSIACFAGIAPQQSTASANTGEIQGKEPAKRGSNNSGPRNLANYGAVFDGRQNVTCSMMSGSTTLNCRQSVFVRGDVGKTISVKNAAATNLSLITTIAEFVDANDVKLTAAATQNTGADQSATWGTDNRAALQKAVTAAAGGTLTIPGNKRFLVKVGANQNAGSIVLSSNTTIRGDRSHTIYFVGVTGTPDGDWGANLFTIPDGASNISFVGLHVIGENYPYTFAGLNQSSVIYGVGATPKAISNIDTSNNLIEYLYGFSFHNAGTGTNWNVRDNTFNYVAKGLNVNANWSKQTGNRFWFGGGLEASGDHTDISHNDFRQAGLQYVISLGGRTSANSPCEGIHAEENQIAMPAGLVGAISAGDCVQRSTIANNKVTGISADESGIVMSYQGCNDIFQNKVSFNQFSGTGGLACIYTAGWNTRDNVFDSNRCDAGFAFGENFSGGGPETSRSNWLKGSVVDQLANTEPNIATINDLLMGTGTRQANTAYGGSFAADSVFVALGSSGPSTGGGATLLHASDELRHEVVRGSGGGGSLSGRNGPAEKTWTLPFLANRQVGFSSAADKVSVAVFELPAPVDFDTITGIVAVPDPARFHHYGFAILTMGGELLCSMDSGIPLPDKGAVDFVCSQGPVHLERGAFAIEWSGDADVAKVFGTGMLMTVFYNREVSASLSNGVPAGKLPAFSKTHGTVAEMPVFQLHLARGVGSPVAEIVGDR